MAASSAQARRTNTTGESDFRMANLKLTSPSWLLGASFRRQKDRRAKLKLIAEYKRNSFMFPDTYRRHSSLKCFLPFDPPLLWWPLKTAKTRRYHLERVSSCSLMQSQPRRCAFLPLCPDPKCNLRAPGKGGKSQRTSDLNLKSSLQKEFGFLTLNSEFWV